MSPCETCINKECGLIDGQECDRLRAFFNNEPYHPYRKKKGLMNLFRKLKKKCKH